MKSRIIYCCIKTDIQIPKLNDSKCIIQAQTLSSLVLLHNLSSSFAVSVQLLTTYLPLQLLLLSVDLHLQPWEDKDFLRHYQKLSFIIWKNPEHLESRTEFYGTSGQSSLRPIKPGLLRENRDKWKL